MNKREHRRLNEIAWSFVVALDKEKHRAQRFENGNTQFFSRGLDVAHEIIPIIVITAVLLTLVRPHTYTPGLSAARMSN